ncbi:3-oxoacyl-[acyl-carrier protein] reductase [Rhodoligotrophos appendicifer]|uniref:SDR family oxidoreductase n=1 Tax=Rhodoligotrophos appendicifer TaxID=987056 RepID=UPI001180D39A|nr:SDR family oxidoreductase [Rhodoligotrophos appendicifer]
MSRLALVIGGGSGLGKASAEALAAQDYHVAVADLSLEAARATTAGLSGGDHRAFAVDVADEASVEGLFDTVEAELGPVSVMANFAGLLIAQDGARIGLMHTSLEDWERSFAVNARGCFLVIREMLRRRRDNPLPHGRIITVSSLAGQIGGVRGSAAYAAAKGAVLTLTKTAAREGGPIGVTANALAPGMIDTPMLRLVLSPAEETTALASLPVGRVGQPLEIAHAITFLASEQSGFMTGATLDINGGHYMR